MKYMLLIHQGTTPTLGSEAWERLADDERNAVYAAEVRPVVERP